MTTTPSDGQSGASGGGPLSVTGTATDRVCVRGHPAMELLEGLIALQQAVRNTENGALHHNSKAYSARLYSCAVCGFMELVDEEFVK